MATLIHAHTHPYLYLYSPLLTTIYRCILGGENFLFLVYLSAFDYNHVLSHILSHTHLNNFHDPLLFAFLLRHLQLFFKGKLSVILNSAFEWNHFILSLSLSLFLGFCFDFLKEASCLSYLMLYLGNGDYR